MRTRRLLLSLVLFALLPCRAASADAVVERLLDPSAIRDYAGIQVLSVYDGHVYHLAIRRAGKLEMVPVATSRAQFDADIGPDEQGRPMLVYARCKTERPGLSLPANGGCDLASYSLAGGGEEPIRGANTSASEIRPTVWKGRIAFARHVKGQRIDVVYTRRIDAPRTTASRRLPGVPRRLPGHERTVSGHVEELELDGAKLAENLSYDAPGRHAGPGAGWLLAEMRVVDLGSGASRKALRVDVGEGGPILTGIGFAGGYLGVALQCIVDCEGDHPGIYRYRLATGALDRATFGPLVEAYVVAMALAGVDSAYTVDAMVTTDDACGVMPDEPYGLRPCAVVLSESLRFKRVG